MYPRLPFLLLPCTGAELPGWARLLHVDVEGVELHVLKGICRTLTNDKRFVLTELIEEQLVKAGTSVREVTGFLFDLGCEAFGIRTARRRSSPSRAATTSNGSETCCGHILPAPVAGT